MTTYPIDPDEMRLCLTGTEAQRERCIQRLADNARADGYHLGLNEGAACAMRGAKSAIGEAGIAIGPNTVKDCLNDPLLVMPAIVAAKH